MSAVRVTVLLALGVLAACGRSASRPPELERGQAGSGRGTGTGTGAPAAPGACTVVREAWKFPAVERVIAIGDVHGDLDATRRALRLARVVDEDDQWIGGTTWVVQTGDQLDRGDDEQAILDWFERLEGEAARAGGRFVWLLGNHEIMNAAGDLRYVTPGGFADFADVPGLPLERFASAPPQVRARLAAFAPGGPYARVLAGQHLVAIVGDTAFVHGGIVPGVAARLDDADQAARCWLAGHGAPPALIGDPAGPLWDRSLAGDDVDCDQLGRALAELGVQRLVIGHTPQPQGVTSGCDGRVWRIDVGMARHYGGPTEVIELTARGAKVLRAP